MKRQNMIQLTNDEVKEALLDYIKKHSREGDDAVVDGVEVKLYTTITGVDTCLDASVLVKILPDSPTEKDSKPSRRRADSSGTRKFL